MLPLNVESLKMMLPDDVLVKSLFVPAAVKYNVLPLAIHTLPANDAMAVPGWLMRVVVIVCPLPEPPSVTVAGLVYPVPGVRPVPYADTDVIAPPV